MSIFEYDGEKHMKCLRQEGFEDGYCKGYDKGEEMKLIVLLCRKMQKNKSVIQIAEELEEPKEVIEKIYKAARIYAPSYDSEEIYKMLHEQ